jgi:hypothetical protein
MKKWVYPIDHILEDGAPANAITNDALLQWLDAYIDPNGWLLKITGGEPGLYPEIDTLIPALEQRGYKGIVETNGSLPIPQNESFPRLAAWHINRDMPEYYDTILIIQDSNDNWEEKIKYCKEHEIPYVTTMLRGIHSSYTEEERMAEDAKKEPTKLDGILMMYSSGGLQLCPSVGLNYGSIFNMDTAEPKSIMAETPCITCPQTQMMDHFYRDFISGGGDYG